jgi:hypothetical protein
MSAEEKRPLIKGVDKAFRRWDLAATFDALDGRILWHIPDRSRRAVCWQLRGGQASEDEFRS